MPEASQLTSKFNLASEGPQAQPDPKKSSLSNDEIRALFKEASERTAKMTPEEIQKQNLWGISEIWYYLHQISMFTDFWCTVDPPQSATSNQAMQALDEAEAPCVDG